MRELIESRCGGMEVEQGSRLQNAGRTMTAEILNFLGGIPKGGSSGSRKRGFTGDQALFAEIIEALDGLGGAAHRDRVVEQIQVSRAERGLSIPPSGAVFRTFERHQRHSDQTARAPLVEPVFGPDSYRWRLTPLARDALAVGHG